MTNFSYQLYSSRNFPPLGETLKMLAEIGYSGVEGYGGLFGDEDEMRALEAGLAETGLTMPTAHVDLGLVRNDPGAALALAKRFDLSAVFGPFLAPEDRPTDLDGWRNFAAGLAEAGKPLWDAGLQFGWHNHDFELVDLGGVTPLELILEADDRLMLELDLAWVAVAGHDPAGWLKRYGDRVLSVHLKDRAPEGENLDEDGWADLGHGTLDWAAIWPAVQGSAARHFVVEHDNPSDHRRFATRSLASAKSF